MSSDRGRGPQVRSDPATRVVYATDNSIYQVMPEAVALPRSAADVVSLLVDNHARTVPRPVVARGGGTGTNGQSLTDGLVVDLKRGLDRVLTVDPEARVAVVEPGVVTGALNARLAAHGLFWAPHTSTLNRATVGGMISTDAAGKGSLVHGRAHRHVLALDVVLDDGTPWRAEPTPRVEAERLAAGDDRIGRLWRALLELPLDGCSPEEVADRLGLPSLARGFSGYGIDRFRRYHPEGEVLDPIALLCGAEGTLGVITSATLRLTPIPSRTVLMVASYGSFADALADAIDLTVTKPTAIESFDETTLERGRSSPAWPALGAVVGPNAGSVLLLEYSGEEEIDLEPIVATLARTGRSQATRALHDPADRAAAWKVRADAVGLLAKVATGGPERSARPTAFVEDCAVPVRAMPEFIAGFREVLDRFGVTYGMFGHADVGCVHVRPALDLTDPEHETMVRRITDEVVALVAAHGGVLWGEHGRGFRGDVAAEFLPDETIEVMRRVKAAFDPGDVLNPGKLYRPSGSTRPLIGLDEPPLRGQANRRIPLAVRDHYADAFACNGNGLCLQHDKRDVMCPSYLATGDPALSPRGRADLLRAWLAGEVDPGVDPAPNPTADHHPGRTVAGPDADALADAVARNLDQCLSCSACAGQCPVEVDIPELKSRFFERYHQRRRRPASHRLLRRFEQMAGAASMAPTGLSRLGGRLGGRALGLVDLPTPVRVAVPSDVPRFDRTGAPPDVDVVVLPDVFTRSLEARTLPAALTVLGAVGHRVAIGEFVPSGKFDHVKGMRASFARAVAAQAELVAAVVEAGAVPVVIEPAITLLHGHEYPAIHDGYPVGHVRNLAELLDERRDRIRPVDDPRAVTLLGHCTERALAPGWAAAWIRVLAAAGHEVSAPAVGCCGMAGIFGHEVDNQEVSRTLFDRGWAPHLEGASNGGGSATVAATGYSCRSQTGRFARARAVHPVTLLGAAPSPG